MKSKLTLRIEESLIKEAKEYASQKGTSVSKLVADFFKAIQALEGKDSHKEKLPPITASLIGILKNKDLDEKDYKKHLENKYLK